MANSYLSRSGSTPTNSKKFTYSFWVKRSTIGADQAFLSYETDSNNRGGIELQSGDKFRYFERVSGSNTIVVEPSRVFRDVAAWYHIVVATDTTQSTASDRVKIYVNGVQETVFTTATYPSLNSDTRANGSTVKNIGRRNVNDDYYFDGYLSHAAFVDGSALAPTSFGETDSTSGIWKFKQPTGVTFGNNGFHLKFENSGALGTDSSGNSNTFTVNGNLKQAVDTPSNSYATLNSLNVPTSNAPTFSFANTKTITMNSDPGHFGGTSTFGASQGKWYTEIKITDDNGVGAVGITFDPSEKARQGTTFSAQISDSFIYANTGKQYSTATGTSGASYGNTYTDADIIGIAMDLDNSKLYFHKNGTYQNSGVPTSGSTGTGAIAITAGETYFFYLTDVGGTLATYECNFGNGHFGVTAITSAGSNGNGSLFEYDVPSGYYALNTKNINTYG